MKIEPLTQAMRPKKFRNPRFRAMLAIASFIIRY